MQTIRYGSKVFFACLLTSGLLSIQTKSVRGQHEYTPLTQDDISGPLVAAQNARLAGDCALFRSSLERFETLIRNTRLQPTLLQRPTNTPEYQTYLRLKKEGCHKAIATNSQPGHSEGVTIELGGSAVARRVTGTVQRIARDQAGTIRYDLGNEDQNGSGSGFGARARVPIGNIIFGYKSYINFGYDYSSVQGNGSGGQGTTADFILFPGLAVGTTPNGFAAGGGMPFSYQYDFTQRRHTGEVAVGFEIERGPVEFYPWVGMRFGSNSVEDSYRVSRPAGVPINAAYTTDSSVNSLGAFIGLSVSVQPQGSPVEVYTQGRVGVDKNWASTDVGFNIAFPGTNETQSVSLSQDKSTAYGYFELGAKAKLGVVRATLAGFVEYGGYAPNISIPGGGASPVLQGESETKSGAKFVLSVDTGNIQTLQNYSRR